MPVFESIKGLDANRTAQLDRILSAALQAVEPRIAVRQAAQREGARLTIGEHSVDLSQFRRARLVGAGKAAQAMARGVLDILGEMIVDGVIITKHSDDGGEVLPEHIRVLTGGHPLPTRESVSATVALVDLLASCGSDDLIICLISGGGSALMTLPAEGTDLDELQELTRLLLASGADIGEMNTLRKHLDQLKGGGLARLAAPAQVITLILSDVIGSPLDVIASGPTVADSTTYGQALDILRKYDLERKTPPGLAAILQRGAAGQLVETLKPGDSLLARVVNHIVASNLQAAQAGLATARQEGFHTMLLTTFLQGEAAQAGIVLASLLRQIEATGHPLRRPACLAAGGETTVTVHGQGAGGRNQELALGAAFLLSDLDNVALVSLGTDGEDGPTDAAGALVTGDTLQRACESGLDPQAFLQNNDSYHFFHALGDLIRTGPTGTNVNDLVFLFAFA